MTKNWQKEICYIVGAFPGTSETFILNEIDSLEKNGLSIRLFSLSHNTGEVLHNLAKKWVSRTQWTPSLFSPVLWLAHLHFALKKPKKYFTAWTRIKEFGGKKHFIISVYFAWIVQKKGIQHIYGQFGWCAGPAMLIGYLMGVGYSFILHHADILFVPQWNITQLVNQSQFCVTISQYNKWYLIEKWPNINPDKIKVIHLGVNIKKFAPVNKDVIVGEKVNLLNVARLTILKNIPFLISICKQLKEREYDFNCIVVGEGPERTNIEKQINKFGLEDCIHLVGKKSQEELPAVYNKCDIFVMTSISEGIPVVIMEAMSCGLPLVAPDITGISELVVDGQTGFLFNKNDPDQATNAVIKLIDNLDLRTELADQGRQKVISEFDINTNAGELAKLMLKELDYINKITQ